MEDIKLSIGGKIRKKRNEKGIKLDALADAVDISSASLSRIENGTKDITISELEKIAKQLELPIHYFTSEPINIHQENNNDYSTGVHIEQHSETTSNVKNLEKLLTQKDYIINNQQQTIEMLQEKIQRKDLKINELKKEKANI